MKSGLEGRNNPAADADAWAAQGWVSMKSGLEGRNNPVYNMVVGPRGNGVSMKSGLEGRNNPEESGYNPTPQDESQ